MWGPTITGRPSTAGSRMLCPPLGTRLPPDEHHPGQGVDLGQLAQGVEQDDVGRGRGSRLQHRPAHAPKARARAPAPARRSKRSGCRGAMSSQAEGTRSRTFWKAESTAASSPSTVLPATTSGPSRRRRVGQGLGGLRGLEVELHVARDPHPVRRERPGRGCAPRGRRPASGTGRPRPAPGAAAGGCGGSPRCERSEMPAVDHRHGDAAPPRLVDEVGPDLRLHEDEQGGLQPVEGLPHGTLPVEGREEQPLGRAKALAAPPRDRWGWWWRGRRHGRGSASRRAATRGRAASTSPTETAWTQMLRGRPAPGAIGQAAHPLGEGAQVASVGPTPPEIEGQDEDEAEREQDGIEEVQEACSDGRRECSGNLAIIAGRRREGRETGAAALTSRRLATDTRPG